MNSNKVRIIAVICLLVFCVGIFAACKKKETDEKLVSVETDENGSLYYTDPTYEVDGIEYGGETHFVKPEETNKNGEYKIGDTTSAAYTTNESGEIAPVVKDDTASTPSSTQGTTQPGGSSNGTTAAGSTTNPANPTNPTNPADPTQPTSGNNPTDPTASTDTTDTTGTTEELSFEGIDGVVDENKLSNDGVINAW